MQFSIFTANCSQNAKNTQYPNLTEIRTAGGLAAALGFDHVCAKYTNDIRGEKNFEWSDVLMLDCDNDHSENPDLWVTPDVMADFFPDVAFAVAPSRNNNKEKGSHASRPRFHVYFPVETVKDAEAYAALKKKIYERFNFFDKNALDAARFVFGTPMTAEDILWHEGDVTIDRMIFSEGPDFLADPVHTENGSVNESAQTEAGPKKTKVIVRRKLTKDRVIKEGSRNTEMHSYAVSLLKRLGDTEDARQIFEKRNRKDCVPPLGDGEMDAIWNSAAAYYHSKIETSPDYVSPEAYRANPTYLKPKYYSDLGMAEIFAREYRDRLIYTQFTDYLSFDGTVWKESKKAAIKWLEGMLYEMYDEACACVEIAENALLEVGVKRGILLLTDRELLKAVKEEHMDLARALVDAREYKKCAKAYQNKKGYEALIQSVEHKVEKEINALDADPYLLNTPAGVVDLRRGMDSLRPNRPEDLCTKITAVAPGDEGREKWENFLNRVFCGDTELIEFVQKVIGMTAFGKVFKEGMIIAYGFGRNGKSTLMNAIADCYGNYSRKISAELFMANSHFNKRAEMAELRGIRFALASEGGEGYVFCIAILKATTSTDNLLGEKKYKQPFEFTPSHTIIFPTNKLPEVHELDEGTWRRLTVIPFLAHIEGGEEVQNYKDHLVEEAGPYILKWIIEGAKKAYDEGFNFKLPRVVEEATSQYRETNNWVKRFIEDCCEVGSEFRVQSSDLYNVYRRWCERNGEIRKSQNQFPMDLETCGFKKVKRNSGRYFLGLKIKDELCEGAPFLNAG